MEKKEKKIYPKGGLTHFSFFSFLYLNEIGNHLYIIKSAPGPAILSLGGEPLLLYK